jgi:predicted metal-dependent phosphoesterase TrpH
LIDLHTHTTASDGRCTPAELVSRAAAAGIRVLSVTDHDTVAGCQAAADACEAAGIEFVPGIEVTAVHEEVDVHTLGYFIDTSSAAFAAFLVEQRRQRIDRAREMIERLGALGIALDSRAILQPALDNPSQSVGRPWLARAMVSAGHVASTNEAFDRWLARGRPAFVPRAAAAPAEVISRIHEAGGIASIAHPGLLKQDDWLTAFVRDGADAIEAYHSDHDAETTARYVALAGQLGIAVSGGSDYHADQSHGGVMLGGTELPAEEYERLVRLSRTRTGRRD